MSDYSDFSSDEEELILRRAPRVFRHRRNPMIEMGDEMFKMRFRLSKDVVERLELKLRDTLQKPTQRNYPLSPMCMLLITLRFYATGSFQMVVGDLFNIDKSTASTTIHKVTRQIASWRPEFITMPTERHEAVQVMRDFHEIGNLPCILGAIDCTHVAIISPGGNDAEIFRNRHGWFSLNVQAICDSKLRFRNVVARWPGSAHDSNIFKNSRIRAQFEVGEFQQGLLLGDSGYSCCRYLLTPVLHEETDAERAYNRAHRRTRSAIERAFRMVKRRFPCLRMKLQVKLPRVPPIIVATFVLSNVAISANDDLPDIDHHAAREEMPYIDLPEVTPNEGRRGENTAVRTAIINNLFT